MNFSHTLLVIAYAKALFFILYKILLGSSRHSQPPRVTLTWKKPQYPEGYGSFFQSNVLLVSISSILNSFVFL